MLTDICQNVTMHNSAIIRLAWIPSHSRVVGTSLSLSANLGVSWPCDVCASCVFLFFLSIKKKSAWTPKYSLKCIALLSICPSLVLQNKQINKNTQGSCDPAYPWARLCSRFPFFPSLSFFFSFLCRSTITPPSIPTDVSSKQLHSSISETNPKYAAQKNRESEREKMMGGETKRERERGGLVLGNHIRN